MSVDTSCKGKNLSPYRTVRKEGVKILVAPNLIGFADSIVLDVKGKFLRRVKAEISRDGDACSI